MMKIYNNILLFVLAFVAVGCINDGLEPDTPSAGIGNEVVFGLSLGDPQTRTVYGPEEDNAFPIYWDNGDKVQIYSPECAAGRNDAEYSVKPVSGQSYAESLTKTGAYGVQWGDKTNANFYSVYPSLDVEFSGYDDAVTAKLNISNTQNANLSAGVAADMSNVIMYAQTNNAKAGETVNLRYKPYSTVLQFAMKLGQSNNGWGRIKVSSLTLTAPEGIAIAGDFNLRFNDNTDPTISAAGNNTNSITVSFNTAPILNESNKTTNINVALIPLNSVTNLTGWTVKLDCYLNNDEEVTTYTKKLDSASNLMPGRIHKIALPEIVPEVAWKYSLDSWISSLYDYKNIYLTELSLPGAWYALGKNDGGYQENGHTASSLWDKGIRAFAVECRSYTPRKTINIGDNTNDPTRVAVSGLGSNQGGAYTHQTLQSGTMKYIADVISDIAGNIKSTEFGVLILSYADGGSGGHRPNDYSFFINGIKTEIENSKVTNIVTDVTENTTVGEVLGQLIIKINVDYNIPVGSYSTQDMNALLSYNPHLKQLDSELYSVPLFSKLSWKKWDGSNDYKPSTTATTDFLWCFSSANRTHTDGDGTYEIPTFAQRQTALRTMISHSHEISESGNHNVWFYFNCGGTEASSLSDDTDASDAQAFATKMNPWLLEVINLKSNGGVDTNGYYTGIKGSVVKSNPSPLGIVMFNQCTNSQYNGQDIVKAIVDMNDKFKLLRKDPNVTRSSYGSSATTGGSAF